MSKVKDVKLASQGKLQIEWAESRMPVLMRIRSEFEKNKPLKGIAIGACLHVTKETAVLVKTLKAGGAKVFLCGSNPLSTQDDVAAALASEGVEVFAWRAQTNDEYYSCIQNVLDAKPNITLDDGADLITEIHTKRQELIKSIIGGCEETTTGVIRLRAMDADNKLRYPVIAINDTPTKRFFDNFHGTAQSTLDGILRATNILLAGKVFVVCGYGFCGRGLSNRARGMGSNVIVCETDPVKALQATMDGFRVMKLDDAARVGDVFVTVTGDRDVITAEHMKKMKSGAILANSGHFNVEINISDLEKMSKPKRRMRENLDEYALSDGRKIYLLGEGRLINLAAGEGHPSEVMDMSFANQALCAEFIAKNKLQPKVHDVPDEIDSRVAKLKLEAMGISNDQLTDEQRKYLTSWSEGT